MEKQLLIHDIEVGFRSLDEWSPENERDFEFCVDIEIGLDGTNETMLFYLTVTSLLRLHSIIKGSFLSQRFIVEKYEPKNIYEFIERIVNLNKFDNWEDAIEFLKYYFSHEYFNYNNKYKYIND